MGKLGVAAIVGTVVSLILIGALLPIGLTNLVAYNGTYTNSSNASQVLGVNSTVGTLVGTVIPIMGVLGLVMGFIAYRNRN